MNAGSRPPPDPQAFFRALETAPWQQDFYEALRRIECLFPAKPRLGTALRPADEPVRLAQEPALDFAPASLSAFRAGTEGRPPRMEVRFFGLFGPNGPLPIHLTDYARERILHAGDRGFARFLDVFHHRLTLLFYRAWAQAQPTVSLDRPRDDRFAALVGSLVGVGTSALRERDAAGDHAKLHFAGLLVRQARNADGLAALLAGYFRLPVRIEPFVGHWMRLPAGDRSRLGEGSPGVQLGVGTVLGSEVWDRQHKFRIHLGPLGLGQYESFLPGGLALARLVALVRQYLGFELAWDVRPALRRDEVPRTRLGAYGRLGWTTWLGAYRRAADADPMTLDAEAVLARQEAAAKTKDNNPAPVTTVAFA